MKVLSLFAGIGGFDLGLERAGFDITAQVEIDPFCQKVLEKHWPEVERYGDIRELDDFPKADLICAGFPCQDISVAGKGTGLSGPRSGLWTDALRAVRMVRPKYVLLENVAALRNRGLCVILGALAEGGYDTEWDCLPASAFGAPHQRDRMFVVAHSESVKRNRGLHSRRGRARSANGGSSADAMCPGFSQPQQRCILSASIAKQDWGQAPTAICGVDDGIPGRVDRIRSLGNAIVPQIPEWIGKQIIAAEEVA